MVQACRPMWYIKGVMKGEGRPGRERPSLGRDDEECWLGRKHGGEKVYVKNIRAIYVKGTV